MAKLRANFLPKQVHCYSDSAILLGEDTMPQHFLSSVSELSEAEPFEAPSSLAICLHYLLVTALHHCCHFTGLDLYRRTPGLPPSIFHSFI